MKKDKEAMLIELSKQSDYMHGRLRLMDRESELLSDLINYYKTYDPDRPIKSLKSRFYKIHQEKMDLLNKLFEVEKPLFDPNNYN